MAGILDTILGGLTKQYDIAMPAVNFVRGLALGPQEALMTPSMQLDLARRAESKGGDKGALGYENFGLDVAQPMGRFTGGLFGLDPTAFANVGSVGRVTYEKDPTQFGGYKYGSTEYNFTPDKDTGSTGNKILDFINEGGLAQKLANLNLSNTLSNSIFTPAYGDIPTKEERQGIESFNNLVSDTVMAEPQIAQTEPAARNNQADILQIINQMEEEKKNYYTQPEEQPDFIDTVLSSLQKGAQYYGGSQIGAGLGSLSGLGPLGFAIGALTGGKFLGGADTSMTPMDRYNQNTFGGYGNMGVQDRYGINTVSLFGNYNKYANRMANKPGPFQSYYQDIVNKQNKQEAQQFADIRQQSESSGGYNPSTGYTAETASGLEGTGGSHHGYSTDYSSPF
jgi:hypothetical protein